MVKRGRELLWEGRFEEADSRFGIARILDRKVLSTLSWKELEAFRLELGDSGSYGVDAREFLREVKIQVRM